MTTWPPDGYTTPSRAAEQLGISRARLYQIMAADPPRRTVQADRVRLVSLADVARWAGRNRDRHRPRQAAKAD